MDHPTIVVGTVTTQIFPNVIFKKNMLPLRFLGPQIPDYLQDLYIIHPLQVLL